MTVRRTLPVPRVGSAGVTEWFPGTVKPLLYRFGIYQRWIIGPRWSYWDGMHWYRGALTRSAAGVQFELSKYQTRYCWRGVTLPHTLARMYQSDEPWNLGTDRPARANVYQRRLPDGSTCFAMWDLAHWYIGAPTIAQALKRRIKSPLQQIAEWREIK